MSTLESYPTLKSFEILARTGITTVDTTTVNNGYYGSTNGVYSGPFVPTGSPSGVNNNSVALTVANTELAQLTASIAALPSPQPIPAPVLDVVTFTPGKYVSGSAITFSTVAINFDAQNDPDALFYIIAASSITFTTITMNLLNGAQACHIYWLASAAEITFTTLGIPIVGNLIAGTSITFTDTPQIDGHIYAQTAVSFTGITLANAIACAPVCYVKGTKILTENGYVAIENLHVDDKVVTKGKIHNEEYINLEDEEKLETIIWTGKFNLSNLTSVSLPICITANSLGENFPFEDLYVSPVHRILLEGKMVQAKELVNEKTIFQDDKCNDVVYYHLELESHSAIMANGVLSESYLDVDNRHIFEKKE